MSEVKLKPTGGGSGSISLKAPASTTGNADFPLILPQNDGDADQYLQTNGSGTLSWATVSAGGGGATGTDYNDDVKVRFGTGNDLELYHSSDDSFISNVTNTDLIIRNLGNAGITLQTQNSYNVELKTNAEDAVKCVANGAVELYNNNKLNLATTGGGVKVSSPDGEATLQIEGFEGNAATLQLNADEGDDNNDFFRLRNNNNNTCSIESYSGGSWKTGFQMTGEGKSEIYYDGTRKFETTTDGATVTGKLRVDISTTGTAGGGTAEGIFLRNTNETDDNAVTIFGGADDYSNAASAINFVNVDHSANYGDVSFDTRGSGGYAERFRIKSDGKIGVNTSVPDVLFHVKKGDSGGAVNALAAVGVEHNNNVAIQLLTPNDKYQEILFGDVADAGVGYIQYNHSSDTYSVGVAGSTRMYINSQGRFHCQGIYDTAIGETNRDTYAESSGQVGYVSSVRASKINIADLTDTSWVFNLQPKTFNFRKQDADGNWTNEAGKLKQWGLIAEEVESVEKDLCFYDVDGETEVLRGINYSKLIAPLIKIVKDQKTEIDQLKSDLTALTARVTTLEAA